MIVLLLRETSGWRIGSEEGLSCPSSRATVWDRNRAILYCVPHFSVYSRIQFIHPCQFNSIIVDVRKDRQSSQVSTDCRHLVNEAQCSNGDKATIHYD